MADELTPVIRLERSTSRFATWLPFEIFAVIVACFLALIAMGHVAQTNWADTFLYNGDSLALPLMKQSILRGEPFEWVFSSQNYFFPEALIYFFASIFTNSARAAMYINGCLNVVILYVLFRAVTRQLVHGSRHRFIAITIALVATFIFVVFVLLEPSADVNGKGIATLFLFSTYYDGVILSGLGVIALTLWLTRGFGLISWGRRRTVIYAIAVVLITSLTAFSDPLYLLQLVAPLAAAAIFLVFLTRLSWHGFWILAVPTGIGVFIAVALRVVFSKSFASSIGGYISFSHIPDSLHLLLTTLRQMVASTTGVLSVLLLCGTLAVTVCIFVFTMYAQPRPRLAISVATSEVFVVSFVSFSSISLFAGMVITGSTTTRYLLPIYVFPLLTIVSVGVHLSRRMLAAVARIELRRSLIRFAVVVVAFACVLVIVLGSTNVRSIARSASGVDYTGAQCFDDFVGNSKVNGVGSYWTVRTLALYGTSNGLVAQADGYHGPLEVFAWINNLGAYRGKKFSYVITDASNQIGPSGVSNLGKPNRVVNCPGYLIYDYHGTRGEVLLNSEISSSLHKFLDPREGR